jgi:hypothetical protein
VPVVAVCLEVFIVPDNCLVFEGFENGIAYFLEHTVVPGVAFDELRHLLSCGRVFDYQPKDGFGEVQALDLMAGHGSCDRDIEHPAHVFGGIGFRFSCHFSKLVPFYIKIHSSIVLCNFPKLSKL